MRAQQEIEAGILVVGAGRTGAVGRRLAGTAPLRTGVAAPGSVLVVRDPR
jgi:D-arabinose 5-phosphate isomerase GutQ